eukprot:TRINITY_DN1916_c0_g1_i1.p1 TRINITY_DN1916_c0_g1~~TRINITY_DN1916_c0_g1_i1.p1  ORF type:complete len:684 (+),score=74.60 TRINITY_DN1916_c0_g1_i1:39-2054(+)
MARTEPLLRAVRIQEPSEELESTLRDHSRERKPRVKAREDVELFFDGCPSCTIQEGTLGTVITKDEDGGFVVAFDGRTTSGRVSKQEAQKLCFVDVPHLRPLTMVEAAQSVGWFFDVWQMDRRAAMRSLAEGKLHPLRGCFSPPELVQSQSSHFHRISTSADIQQTMSGSINPNPDGDLKWTLVVWLAASIMFQIYCLTFLRANLPTLKHSPYAGFLASSACFIAAKLIFFGWDSSYVYLQRISSERTWVSRNLFTTGVYDKMALNKLPNVMGQTKNTVICGVLALLLPSTFVAAVGQDVGVLAFGLQLSYGFLAGANTLLGECSSLRPIRERDMAKMLCDCKNRAEIDIPDLELQVQFEKFLAHEPYNKAIVMDLRLFVVLATLIVCEKPDSVRLRHFVVKGAFFSATKPELLEHWDGELHGCHDVMVDVARGTCKVIDPDAVAGETYARWIAKGSPLPWQIALRPDATTRAQFSLQALGMDPGSSAFSPGPMVLPHWENWEATHQPAVHFERAKAMKVQQDELADTLIRIVSFESYSDDDVRLVEALIHAGAQVNDARADLDHGACRALFFCIKGDHRLTAQRLIKYGANLHGKYAIGEGCETPTEYAKRLERTEILADLSEAIKQHSSRMERIMRHFHWPAGGRHTRGQTPRDSMSGTDEFGFYEYGS